MKWIHVALAGIGIATVAAGLIVPVLSPLIPFGSALFGWALPQPTSGARPMK